MKYDDERGEKIFSITEQLHGSSDFRIRKIVAHRGRSAFKVPRRCLDSTFCAELHSTRRPATRVPLPRFLPFRVLHPSSFSATFRSQIESDFANSAFTKSASRTAIPDNPQSTLRSGPKLNHTVRSSSFLLCSFPFSKHELPFFSLALDESRIPFCPVRPPILSTLDSGLRPYIK